jgi:hypothetical protein
MFASVPPVFNEIRQFELKFEGTKGSARKKIESYAYLFCVSNDFAVTGRRIHATSTCDFGPMQLTSVESSLGAIISRDRDRN